MRNINAGLAIGNWRPASAAGQGQFRLPTELGTLKSERDRGMSIAISEFWKLAVESRLLTPADCRQLEAGFAHVKGAASQGNGATLGE